MFDLILEGGTVIDGTRSARFDADVGIQGDKIAAIGNLAEVASRRRLAVRNRFIAPGFIDVHNHSDGWLLRETNLVGKTTQGFTSEVLMSDGISYAPVNEQTFREWFIYLRGLNGLQLRDYAGWQTLGEFGAYANGRSAQNFNLQIPYANIRTLVKGFDSRPLTDEERKRVRYEIAAAMEQGAVGLSTGLDYIAQCFSSTDELIDACRSMAPANGIYATHIRYKSGLLEGVREAVEIAEQAEVALHISHLKPLATSDLEPLLQLLDEAESRVDLSFDLYPYFPGSTMLSYLLPYEVWEEGPLAAVSKLNRPEVRERFRRCIECYGLEPTQTHIAWTASKLNSDLQGLTLDEVASRLKRPLHDALLDLLMEENLAVLMVLSGRFDELIEPMMAHPKFIMGSDGIFFHGGAVHPRMFGSTGRFLGEFVREKNLCSWEDAIYKLAGAAASRFGMSRRGTIEEGHFADLVVFDPATVAARATFDDPQQFCAGIDHVLVNGEAVVTDGQPHSLNIPAPGRFLKFRPGL